IATQLKWVFVGLLTALMITGWVISRFIPRQRGTSTPVVPSNPAVQQPEMAGRLCLAAAQVQLATSLVRRAARSRSRFAGQHRPVNQKPAVRARSPVRVHHPVAATACPTSRSELLT